MSIARLVLTTALLVAVGSPGLAEEAAPEKEEPKGWTGKVGFGGTVSAGTTDSFGANLAVNGERTWDANLVRLGLLASYGKTSPKGQSSVKDNDEQRLTQYYRRTLSERYFLYAETEQARDRVRNINLRLLAVAGPGYRAWIGENDAYLDLEAGIGYRYEDYRDTTATKESSRNDVNGRIAFDYRNKFGAADFGQNAEFLLPFNDTGGFIARSETKLSFPLLESWSFENSLGLEYFNDPPAGSNKFELDYIVSLVYAF